VIAVQSAKVAGRNFRAIGADENCTGDQSWCRASQAGGGPGAPEDRGAPPADSLVPSPAGPLRGHGSSRGGGRDLQRRWHRACPSAGQRCSGEQRITEQPPLAQHERFRQRTGTRRSVAVGHRNHEHAEQVLGQGAGVKEGEHAALGAPGIAKKTVGRALRASWRRRGKVLVAWGVNTAAAGALR